MRSMKSSRLFDLLATERALLAELTKLAEVIGNGNMVNLGQIDFGRSSEKWRKLEHEEADQRVRQQITQGSMKDLVHRKSVPSLATALKLLVEGDSPRPQVKIGDLK